MARFDTVVSFVLTVWLEALWQPLIVAAITWAVLRALRNTNATTRHAVWTCALAASVVLPVASAIALASGYEAAHGPAASRFTVWLPQAVVLAVLAVWPIGSSALLLRLVRGWAHLSKLQRDAFTIGSAVTPNGVRVGISSGIDVPIAIGLFDSLILLPVSLVGQLDRDDLDRILLHELAHLRRRDDWTNILQRTLQALLFFSPGIHLMAAQTNLEREVACDDWVLARTRASLPYARCLARLVERVRWPPRSVPAPGAFNTRRHISIRIERLLSPDRNACVRLAVVPAIAGIAASFAFAMLCTTVLPRVASVDFEHSVVLHGPYASQCPLQRDAKLRNQG